MHLEWKSEKTGLYLSTSDLQWNIEEEFWCFSGLNHDSSVVAKCIKTGVKKLRSRILNRENDSVLSHF